MVECPDYIGAGPGNIRACARNKNEEWNSGSVKKMVSVNWSALGLGAVIAFLIGWFIFGLLGAVILAIIAMIVLGIMKF